MVTGPDDTLITAGADRALRSWDINTGALRWTQTEHQGWVWPVAVSPQGHLLATSDNTGRTYLRDASTGRLQRVLLGPTAPVWTAAFRPDGGQLACSGLDQVVKVWDTTTGELVAELSGHGGRRTERELAANTGSVYRVVYHPDGELLATADQTGLVRVWDVPSGKLLHRLEGHQQQVFALDFHPHGKLLASADTGGMIRLWAIPEGRGIGTLNAHREAIYQVLFSPHGSLMASCDSRGDARLWSVDPNAEPVLQPHTGLVGHQSAIWPGSFRPDSQQFATASSDSVRLWDTTTGQNRHLLRGHGRKVASVSFKLRQCDAGGVRQRPLHRVRPQVNTTVYHPSGALLASAGDDSVIHLWDPHTGKHLQSLDGHMDAVSALAFSPDGRLLASGGADGTVRLWNVSDPLIVSLRATLVGYAEGWVAFGPDGGYKTDGAVANEFWQVVGGCRFDPGELNTHINDVRRMPME